MFIKKISLTIFCSLVFTLSLFAQIRYCVYTKGGFSNFIEKNYEKNFQIANDYTALPSFNLGADVYLPFFKADLTDFQFITGLDFGSFAAKNNIPDSFFEKENPINPPFMGPRSWDERFYSLSVPVKVNFKFEKWVHIYGGLVYTFYLNKPEDIFDKKVYKNTLNFTGGIDFLIMNHFTLGASYYRNLTPSMKFFIPDQESKSTYWYVQQVCLKVGYVF